jgi:SOS response associated peptidase (SRAP)
MCGRFTVKATWAELVALYSLTMDAPPHNLRPRYNVCPTDPVDVVTAAEGKRELVTMRWGLVPRWWSKPLKELRMATFNARAETVETKPVFRDAFKRSHCLIPMSGYHEWQNTPGKAAVVLHGPRWLADPDRGGLVGRMEKPRDRRAAEVLHDDRHRTERIRCANPRPHACILDGGAICAVAKRRGGSGHPEASAE